MARWRLAFLFLLLSLAAVLAWWAIHRQAALFAPPLRLTPVEFVDLPNWNNTDPRGALTAFARSCAALSKKPGSSTMGGAGYADTVADWRNACDQIPQYRITAADARAFFMRWAQPVAVSVGDDPKGTFTGYYEPEIDGSVVRHGAYQTPVYATPDNLVSVDAGDFVPELAGRRFTGCAIGHKLKRCPDRGEIDAQGIPTAKVLFYANDPIAVFFLHIQGSGRVRFDDGSTARVNYDSQNGQPYTAVGRTLIAMGVPRDGMSMQVIRKWLKDHPQDAQRVMESDKSFVFFREEPTGNADAGAEGSEGVPLTAGRSLAVDMKLHPLGIPMYVVATRPDADLDGAEHTFDTLMVAQDSGGAIKGAVRGDVFWGFGTDAAAIAGRMKSSGRLYVLLPKALVERIGTYKDYSVP